MSEQLDMNGIIKLAELKIEDPKKYKQTIEALKEVTETIMDSAMGFVERMKKLAEE